MECWDGNDSYSSEIYGGVHLLHLGASKVEAQSPAAGLQEHYEKYSFLSLIAHMPCGASPSCFLAQLLAIANRPTSQLTIKVVCVLECATSDAPRLVITQTGETYIVVCCMFSDVAVLNEHHFGSERYAYLYLALSILRSSTRVPVQFIISSAGTELAHHACKSISCSCPNPVFRSVTAAAQFRITVNTSSICT